MQARPRTMRSMRLLHLLSWSFFMEKSRIIQIRPICKQCKKQPEKEVNMDYKAIGEKNNKSGWRDREYQATDTLCNTLEV